jgi:excisionase family DNA binding protein
LLGEIVYVRADSKSAFLTRHSGARYLGIGTTFLDNLIRSGVLPAFKLGRRTVLLRREDLDRVATARPLASATAARRRSA